MTNKKWQSLSKKQASINRQKFVWEGSCGIKLNVYCLFCYNSKIINTIEDNRHINYVIKLNVLKHLVIYNRSTKR